jgi:sialate O-acetylesterase
MVLQRDVAAPIWGWSSPGDAIAVTVENRQGVALASGAAVAGADGKWVTTIGPLPVGGPLTVTIKGKKRQIVLANVAAGDVWLCSGQSNMGIPVRTAANATQEIARANYPDIRSFNVGFYPSYVPLPTPLPAAWQVCSPETVPEFSGVGYYFARELQAAVKVPVGILHSSVGATAAEVWISADGIRKYMPYDFHEQLATLARNAGDPAGDYFRDIEAWAAAADPESARRRYASDPALDTSDWRDLPSPRPLEEAGLTNFDGLVWFRTWVAIPESWAGRPVSLALGQVSDIDILWVNGTLAGCNQVKDSWRRYTLDGGLLKPGSNLLTVAVLNTGGPGGFRSQPRQMLMTAAGAPGGVGLGGAWKFRAGPGLAAIARPFPRPKLGYYKTLTAMYNGMIAPLTPFAIKGAVWYQGAASWPFWLQYRRLLPALIADWRDHFESGDFPVLIVSQCTVNEKQSRPVEPGYGEIRESQWRTARKVPNTGLVITTDLGDEPVANIHPKNKQDVGLRLALAARHLVYGETNLVHSGPEFTEMMLERKNADPDPAAPAPATPFVKTFKTRLYFKHVGGGLVFKPGNAKPNGFAVAGEDKQFVWADAEIEGDTVVVSAPGVDVPRYVRYGWAYNPITTLFNKEGLPAIPFRTDE